MTKGKTQQSSGASVEPLLNLDGVAEALNAGRRTVERMISTGVFPRADLFIGKRPRWRPDTVRRWVELQSAGA